eukprot:TRINITY_DN113465_c0_g1_i1.p1 TRINITY_DN113465_c0_g1~~TRINITY_DN113465_c0_g1_i1.p1  ORF type:complete len:295 (-),score=17.79 TRINITY_DN113465_c0_g1_i1:37-888(-)
MSCEGFNPTQGVTWTFCENDWSKNGFSKCFHMDTATVTKMRQCVDELTSTDVNNPVAVRFLPLNEEFRTLGSPFLQNEQFLETLEQIIGPGGVLLRMEVFVKHGGQNLKQAEAGYLPFHQDTFCTWGSFEYEMADDHEFVKAGPQPTTIWIALDDTDASNGAMEMCCGTQHQLLNDRSASVPSHLLDSFTKEVYSFKAGEAGLHSSLAVHRSLPNNSPNVRRAVIVRFLPLTPTIQQLKAQHPVPQEPPFLSTHSNKFSWHKLPPQCTKGCPKNTPLQLSRRA